jgi:hypothetical protein
MTDWYMVIAYCIYVTYVDMRDIIWFNHSVATDSPLRISLCVIPHTEKDFSRTTEEIALLSTGCPTNPRECRNGSIIVTLGVPVQQ